MKAKTRIGPSIQAVLKEARRRLDDEAMCMESLPATEEKPARTMVMLDASGPGSPESFRPGCGYAAPARAENAPAAAEEDAGAPAKSFPKRWLLPSG